jgi:hypothetical protein
MCSDFGLQPDESRERHVKTQRHESRKSRQPSWPAIVYGAVPAVLLAELLASGVVRNFQGNWSALFCFGDAWVDGGALPRDPIVWRDWRLR